MESEKPRHFGEFWPLYLADHKDVRSRRLHYLGTWLGLILLFLAALFEQPWLLLAALFSGYGFAWVGHFFIEKNRPATFRHPLWSLRGDFRMFAFILNGKMDAELERLGLKSDSRAGRE